MYFLENTEFEDRGVNSFQKINYEKDTKSNEFMLKLLNFEKFLIDVKLLMSKCKYRKAFEEMLENENKFNDLNFFWKIRELKIRCMQKILNKKMFKSNSPLNQKLKSIDNWNLRIENEIEIWIGNLSSISFNENNSEYEKEIEILIHVILEDIYLNAIYKYQNKQFPEMLGILGIAEKIIKIFWDFSKSVKLIHTCQKIDLFISSLLISDNDLSSAVYYQERVFILIFREFFLRVDKEEKIIYENCPKGIQHCLNKLFLNMINAFYQRGNCEERLGDLLKGTECYKQANWFLANYKKLEVPELRQFLHDVDFRAKEFHILIAKIIEKYNHHKYLLSIQKIDILSQYHSDDIIKHGVIYLLNSAKKSKEIQKKIPVDKDEEFKGMLDKMQHQEFEFFEDNKRSEKLKQILSTVNLLNNFSSEKFRDIIKEMNSLNIQNMDSDQIEKIQKRLNDIRTEEKYCELEKNTSNRKNNDRYIETNNLKAELEQYLLKENNTENKNNYNVYNINTPTKNNNNNCVTNSLSNMKFDKKKTSKIENTLLLNTEKYLSEKTNIITNPEYGFTSPIAMKTKSKLDFILTSEKRKISKNFLDANIPPSKSGGEILGSELKIRHSSNSFLFKNDSSRKIKKYEHDEYIFSSNYQNKIKGINKFMRKETDFQKQLLHLKKYEKPPMDFKEIDINELKNQAKNFFERTFSSCKSGFIITKTDNKKNSKTEKEIKKDKQIRIKEKLEVALIKSCDSKVFSIFDKMKKTEEKNENIIREEFLNLEKSKIPSNEEREKINQKFTQKVDKELNFLEKKQNICKKIIEQDNQLMKSYLQNKGKLSSSSSKLIQNLITQNQTQTQYQTQTNSNFIINSRPTTSKYNSRPSTSNLNLNSRPTTSKNKKLLLDTENLYNEFDYTKNNENSNLNPSLDIFSCKNKINKNFCLDAFVGYDKLKFLKEKDTDESNSEEKLILDTLER